jgi:hypothetical protein
MINKISQTTKDNVRRKSVITMPDEPRGVGIGAKQVKERMAGITLDPTNSAFAEIDRVVDETNIELGVVSGSMNAHTANEDIHTSALEKAAWNAAQPNIIESVKVKGVALPVSEKGVDITYESLNVGGANGIAELDANQKLKPSQLPDGINTYAYYDTFADFPVTGQSSITYVDRATNNVYLWTGSDYTNITANLALGETSSTAYRGDKGKEAHDHSLLEDGSNPHKTTFANILDKPSTLAGYGITDALEKGNRTTIVEEAFTERITATNPIEIIDSPLGVKTAEIQSIKGITQNVGGVITHTHLRKLISTGDNLWDYKYFYDTLYAVNPYQILYEVKDGRNCIKIPKPSSYCQQGIELYKGQFAPNTQYVFNFELMYVSDSGYAGLVLLICYTDGTTSEIRCFGWNTETWGEAVVTSNANKTIAYIGITYGYSSVITYYNIDKMQVQLLSNPNTEYKPYTEDYIDLPDIILQSDDELTPDYHIRRRDEITGELLEEPIYTPIEWDNKYSAYNYGIEKTVAGANGHGMALFKIKYPLDVVKQVETNTEILAEQEKLLVQNAEQITQIDAEIGDLSGTVGDINTTVNGLSGDVTQLQTELGNVATLDGTTANKVLKVNSTGDGLQSVSAASAQVVLGDGTGRSITTSVSSGSTSLPTSGAVYTAIEAVKNITTATISSSASLSVATVKRQVNFVIGQIIKNGAPVYGAATSTVPSGYRPSSPYTAQVGVQVSTGSGIVDDIATMSISTTGAITFSGYSNTLAFFDIIFAYEIT